MKKKQFIGILTMVLIVGLFAGCGEKETGGDVAAGENQRLAYAVVTGIEGNDITYMEVDESQLNLSDEASSESSDSDQKQRQTDGTEMPQMSSEMQGGNGQMPDRSDMSEMGSEMPDMENFTPPDGTGDSSSSGGDITSSGTSTPQGSRQGGMGMMGMTGSTVSSQIPVGVTVHTTADTKTTFSRIQSGDVLKILLETDDDGNEVIIEIWMVQ